ncbi:thioesterase family protein [Streptomyces sp. NPDC059740]|uniref:thioesterase family protein n=1 Tax=Streptomyces sp. NPDC059740 TaxID=3346926 RepID=UPI003652053F
MAQALIGDSEFDRDTRVTRRAPGVYDARVGEGWLIGHAANGGYLMAMAARALGDRLAHPHPFTITTHFLAATQAGPVTVRTDSVRTGRTLSTGTASLFQTDGAGEEVERLRVLATYGDLDALPDDVRTSAKPPELPPYEHCAGREQLPDPEVPLLPDVAMAGRLDMRMDPATAGWAVGEPSGRGELRGWLGLSDGRPHDALSLLLAVDAFPPTTFDLGISGWVPTVELTAHVRAHPAPGPVRVAVTTRNLAGGFQEEDVEIWDSADRLVAQSRQLARVPLA